MPKHPSFYALTQNFQGSFYTLGLLTEYKEPTGNVEVFSSENLINQSGLDAQTHNAAMKQFMSAKADEFRTHMIAARAQNYFLASMISDNWIPFSDTDGNVFNEWAAEFEERMTSQLWGFGAPSGDADDIIEFTYTAPASYSDVALTYKFNDGDPKNAYLIGENMILLEQFEGLVDHLDTPIDYIAFYLDVSPGEIRFLSIDSQFYIYRYQ